MLLNGADGCLRCGCRVQRADWVALGSLALPILFFAVLYFVMIAPNQRKQKKWQEMLGELKSGDRVTTNGGIRGT